MCAPDVLFPQVLSIETPAEAFASVVFHSFHLLLVSVDTAGMVRVNNGMDGGLLNQFHISNGKEGNRGGRAGGSIT